MWINNFSITVKNNLFIFCNREGYNVLNWKLKKYVKVINDIFDINRIRDYKSYYKKMWCKDPERKHHNYRLYGIWNGKISMLKYASEKIESKLYIWIDIGSYRENKNIITFPSMKVIHLLQNITYNSYMFFFQLYPFPAIHRKNITLITKDCIEGGTFGGSKIGIRNYYNEYYKLHDKFLKMNYFIGKDQTLYNTIAYYNISKVVLLKYKMKSCNNYIWFRFYDFYAGYDCASVTLTYI